MPSEQKLPAEPTVDAAWLRGLRERDTEVLSAVVHEHAKGLYRAARAMGVAAGDAEDVVQEVFVRFLEGIDRFGGQSQVRTWLWGILRNRLHEYWRERKREVPMDGEPAADDPAADWFDARGRWRQPPRDLHRLLESEAAGAAIRNCVGELAPRQRAAFVLREMETRATRDICTLLGISANYCGVLIARARLHLRACLERAGWGPAR